MAMFFKKMHRQQNDITKKDLEPVCPYCGNVLDRKPKRKTKCPFCNNDIYVRSKQSIFASTLLIREDAIAIDELKNLENYGIKDNDFIKKRRELSKKVEGGRVQHIAEYLDIHKNNTSIVMCYAY